MTVTWSNAGDFAAEHLLRRLNVEAIPYDPAEGHHEVLEALEEMQRLAPFHWPQLAATA